MTFGYHFEGIERVNAGLDRISRGVNDPRPLFGLLGEEFYRQELAWFEAEPWVPLSPGYAARKQEIYGDKPILRATDVLFKSFTEQGAAGNIHRVGESEAEFGSSDFKAIYHQLGTSRMPARPPLIEPDPDKFLAIADEYVDQLIQRAGF